MREVFRTISRLFQLTCVVMVVLTIGVSLVMPEALWACRVSVATYVVLPSVFVAALVDSLQVYRGRY